MRLLCIHTTVTQFWPLGLLSPPIPLPSATPCTPCTPAAPLVKTKVVATWMKGSSNKKDQSVEN